jgi:hypothetical protein
MKELRDKPGRVKNGARLCTFGRVERRRCNAGNQI